MSAPTAAGSVLITGCSSGIGHHCAHALARRGWRVFAGARRPGDVDRLAHEGLEAVRLDVADSRSIQTAVRQVLEAADGRLDALFNNAGYGQPGAVEDVPREALRDQFETNLFGAHELTARVLPAMRRRGSGRIVNHSSVLGLVALPYRGAYNASKFALEGLTDTLRQELRGSGIQVSLIDTGPVRSRFRENALAMFRSHINVEASAHRELYAAVLARLQASGDAPFTLGPEAVARALVHALESRRARPRYYVTAPSRAFALLRRLLPTRALDALLLASTASERR